MKERGRPLARSLTLNFVFVGVLPLAAIAVLVLTYLSKTTAGDVAQKNMLLSRAVGGQVESFLREPVAVIQNVGAMLRNSPDMEDRQVEELLDTHLLHSEIYESIYVLGPGGRVKHVGLSGSLAEFKDDYRGLDLSHKDFYRKARLSPEPTWSDTFLSLLSGRMSLAICQAVDDRVLVGNFNIDILSSFRVDIGGGDRVALTLVDRQGYVIAHPDPDIAARQVNVGGLEPVKRGLEGEEGTFRYTFQDEEFIGSAALIPGPGWLVLASQRRIDAYSPIWHTAMIFVMGFFAAVLVAVLMTMVMARRVSRPISEFVSRARLVAQGGYDFSLPESGYLEVTDLAAGFRRMTRAIKEREERLRESEEKYRILVENANDAIFVAQDGVMKFANSRTEEMTGYSAADLAVRPFVDIIHPEDRALVAERHRRRLQGEDPPSTYPFRIIGADGREVSVLLHTIVIDWEGEAATLNFVRDITEQKLLELQALQAQKLEAIATLAGGIAHDFNNLLQAIQGYAEICLLQAGADERMQEDLQEIVGAAERGGELTRQLLLFSRKVESRMRPCDLNAEVERTARILERILTSMIEVELRLDPSVKRVNADPSQIEQVLMNLAVNARDAMPEGGKLKIATLPISIGPDNGEYPGAERGEHILMTVTDTGHGADAEVLEHIFEPFYTTKDPGQGTGLGLAMVYGIIKNHHGAVTCSSRPGEGMTFRILLPALEGSVVRSEDRSVEAPKGGAETVLIVDDERSILDMGEKILTTFGYTVLSASDGREALDVYGREGGRIDLVILDMVMPKMGGKQCLRELVALDPGVRVIVSSGYSGMGSKEEFIALGARGLVNKPYSANVMLREVRAALDGAASQV